MLHPEKKIKVLKDMISALHGMSSPEEGSEDIGAEKMENPLMQEAEDKLGLEMHAGAEPGETSIEMASKKSMGNGVSQVKDQLHNNSLKGSEGMHGKSALLSNKIPLHNEKKSLQGSMAKIKKGY